MSDLASALPEAASSGYVLVEEAGLVGMITLRGDLGSSGFSSAVREQTGVDIPERGQRIESGENALLWMSPDELLVVCPHETASAVESGLQRALQQEHALVANVSDARAVFTLSGDAALIRDALAKLTPADLRRDVLPVGAVRRTRLSQVPAAMWFDAEDRATIVCFRSVAQYVFDLLEMATATGSEVGYFR